MTKPVASLSWINKQPLRYEKLKTKEKVAISPVATGEHLLTQNGSESKAAEKTKCQQSLRSETQSEILYPRETSDAFMKFQKIETKNY